MWQLIATIISFLLIPILIKKNTRLNLTIFIATLALGILSGIGPANLAKIIIGVFINKGTRDTLLTIIMISILGGMMKHYNILNKIVESMLQIISNKKIVMAFIPAMVGMLIIPGGAILSAPFVFSLGEELNIAPERRAAINLTFRHTTTFLLPYSTMLLLVKSTFPDINIYKVIGFNAIFVLGALFSAYTIYLKDIEVEKNIQKQEIGKNILRLLAYFSPIYIPVILNISLGTPFYLAVIISLLIIYILGDKKDFLRTIGKSLNFNVVATLAAILMMKDVILNLNDMLILVESLFSRASNNFILLATFLLVSLFFGFITGNSNVPLAVTLPILYIMNLSGNSLYVYLYFLCVSAFLGYYFSPIHLCQVFTLDEMNVNTGSLYKEYKLYALSISIVLVISSLGLMFLSKLI